MTKRQNNDAAARRTAYDTALRLVTRRPHSRAELYRKLALRGYADSDIAVALDSCQHSGYLDDAAVAGRWAEVLVEQRSWGPQKVAAYLYERGIAEDIIARVQQQVWQQHDEGTTARRALEKRFAAVPAPKEKVIRFLQSRGFSAGVIYALQKECEDVQ